MTIQERCPKCNMTMDSWIRTPKLGPSKVKCRNCKTTFEEIFEGIISGVAPPHEAGSLKVHLD